MGDAYTHKGDLFAALRAYREAAQGYGDSNPDPYVCLGNTLLALGEQAEAVAILLPVAEKYPNHAEIHMSAGQALAATGRLAEAQTEWQTVLAIREEFNADGLGDEELEALAAEAQARLVAIK